MFERFLSGRNRSLGFNNTYGKFKVIYPDGMCSINMCKDVANDYAKIFGGKVVAVKEVRR